MKIESMVTVKMMDRSRGTYVGGAAAVAVAALLLASSTARAADPGGSGPGAKKDPPATLKSVPGSPVKQVILTAKAAERLGIELGKVSEEPIVRKRVVSGLVIPPLEKQLEPKPGAAAFGGFGAAPAPKPGAGGFADFARAAAAPAPRPVVTKPLAPIAGDAWVLVALSQAEWESLAKDKPVRLLPLHTRDKLGKEISARPSGLAPLEDTKRAMLQLYYIVPGKEHGLTLNQRMRVELQQSGSDEKRKVVPYGAVYYDAKGTPWVYVNPEPLVFERQRIGVERVAGDVAVLSDGPPVGTPVVTVGAAMLYGVEVFGK
jgi:hypothetical protein